VTFNTGGAVTGTSLANLLGGGMRPFLTGVPGVTGVTGVSGVTGSSFPGSILLDKTYTITDLQIFSITPISAGETYTAMLFINDLSTSISTSLTAGQTYNSTANTAVGTRGQFIAVGIIPTLGVDPDPNPPIIAGSLSLRTP
jgi:hypothetical protein